MILKLCAKMFIMPKFGVLKRYYLSKVTQIDAKKRTTLRFWLSIQIAHEGRGISTGAGKEWI